VGLRNRTKRTPKDAIRRLLEEYAGNDWFVSTCWPENEGRVQLMMCDVLARYVPDPGVRVLDVGCFNGYISFLFSQLGYSVTATDVYESGDRERLFAESSIEFVLANLNDLDPFNRVRSDSFDVVLMGEVVEHVLNWPLGLMRNIARIMRPGGLLIVTTPNPSTVMNAMRLLLDRSLLWGGREFIEMPKSDSGRMICHGTIHYREYNAEEMRYLLDAAGFRVKQRRYLGMGSSPAQAVVKRLLKRSPIVNWLMSVRLFGRTQYLVARRG